MSLSSINIKKYFKFFSFISIVCLVGVVYLIPNFAYAFTDPVQVQIGAEGHPIRSVWEALLNFANVAALIFFLAIAFANLLRIQINVYGIKKILPALIVGIILANFSLLISQLLLDLSGAAAGLFREGSGFTNQWINSAEIFPETNTGDFIHIIFGAVLKIVAAVMVMILAVMFILRNYVLMFLVVFAPIAFLSMALPATKGLWTRWWKSFTQWTFMLPVAMFWLWVGANFFQFTAQFNKSEVNFLTGISFAGYVFGVICVYMAMTTPFKMAGELSSLAGKVQKAALTATGVYAGTRLAQKGIQGVKQAAGETIQGVALNRTPYGNIVRLLKQTGAARKSTIERGLSGSVSRGGVASQVITDVLSLGASKRSRRTLELNKKEKEMLEIQADSHNVDDEELQDKLNALESKASGKKGALEMKKGELRRIYYEGKRNPNIDALEEMLNPEEIIKYQELKKQGDKKEIAKFLQDLLKKKIGDSAVAKYKQATLQEKIKEIEDMILKREGAEDFQKEKSRLTDQALEVEKQKLREVHQEEIKEFEARGATEEIKKIEDEAKLTDEQKIEIEKEATLLTLRKHRNIVEEWKNKLLGAVRNQAASGISSKQIEELQAYFETITHYQGTEGKRIQEALHGELNANLGPAIAKKAQDNIYFPFLGKEMYKIELMDQIQDRIKAGTLILDSPEMKEAIAKLDSDPAKALSEWEEYQRLLKENPGLLTLKRSRLKYSLFIPALLTKAKDDAMSDNSEQAIEKIQKINPDDLSALAFGRLDQVKSLDQVTEYDRASKEYRNFLEQSPMSGEFVPTLQCFASYLANNSSIIQTKIIDPKTGQPLDITAPMIATNQLIRRMGIVDEKGKVTGINYEGFDDRERKNIVEQMNIYNTNAESTSSEGINARISSSSEVLKTVLGQIMKLQTSANSTERTRARSLLYATGLDVVTNTGQQHPVDRIGLVNQYALESRELFKKNKSPSSLISNQPQTPPQVTNNGNGEAERSAEAVMAADEQAAMEESQRGEDEEKAKEAEESQ